MKKIIAKSLFTFDKERKITIKENAGRIYLMITPKRFIGSGATIEDANARTFTTGYRAEEVA